MESKNNLIRYNNDTANERLPSASVETLEGFNKMLNEEPDPSEVQVNKFAANSKYLPISFVQNLLDEFFVGLWETKNFTSQVVANEIIGSVTLRYFHPFAKAWIERTGSAAVMIQQSKDADITDIGAKIKNTLGKDYPHLLASCTASAARSIGKAFGRDLNRKFEDSYNPMYSDIASAEEAIASINWAEVETMKDLKDIWNTMTDLHNNKQFIKEFTYQKNKLNK